MGGWTTGDTVPRPRNGKGIRHVLARGRVDRIVCGIAGLIGLDGQPVDRAIVDSMVARLAHRGPDGFATHHEPGIALGHRRLSILDPSPAGAQPMRRGESWLVHNGEVYNFLELAGELRAGGVDFTTGTDTEVMLAAYEAWGIDAIARFNGMWAFALWDAGRRRLILSRDRLGIKPLYLRRTARSLVFASEPQALIGATDLDRSDHWAAEPDLGAVHDFLTRGLVDHSARSFVRGIEAVPAGHTIVIESGEERSIRYWTAPPLSDDVRATVGEGDRRRDAALLEEFATTFDSAVRLCLRSDVAIGSCLSGGLDSSSIVATAAILVGRESDRQSTREQPARLAFHARFPSHGIDESTYAIEVARLSQTRLIESTPSSRPFLGSVVAVLRAQGEPYAGASIHAQFALMAAAHSNGLKVLLDGQGADELLGGYLSYLGLRSGGLLAAGHPVASARELRDQVRRGPAGAAGSLAFLAKGLLRGRPIEEIRSMTAGRYAIRCQPVLAAEPPLEGPRAASGTRLARRLWWDLTADSLPALLRYEDRNSMAFGIEARVPFLDVRLVELAVGLPDRLRINGGETKLALRRAMAHRLPDRVVNRRDKVAFSAPEGPWLVRSRVETGDLLMNGQLVNRGWIARRDLEGALGNRLVERRHHEQLWRLLVVESWLRMLWPGAAGEGGLTTWQRALEAEDDGRRSLSSPHKDTAA